jgi:hypothetical protein
LSVKEAAELLRLDERSVRERLINGQLKGEKKQIGLRDKWFVYTGSIEAALSKQQGAFAGDPIAFSDVTVDAEPAEEIDSPEGDTEPSNQSEDAGWLEANRDKVRALAEEIVKPLMEKIETQAEVIFEQKHIIGDQERQLRLLPDLQKQAEQRAKDVELRHVENEALKKQIAALQEQVEASKKPWWKKLIAAQEK